MSEGMEDTVQWTGAKNGLFSMKCIYKALVQRTVICFPWKCTWKNCVQPKVSFFAWEAS